VCVCLPIVSFCQSDDTTIYIIYTALFTQASVFYFRFCVRTGNRAKDSRTADHTRNHRARPRRRRLRTSRLRQTPSAPQSMYIRIMYVGTFIMYRKVPHDLFYYIFFSLSDVIYRLYTDAVPKRKHTSGCVSLLYSSVPVG